MTEVTGSVVKYPARASFLWYLLLIVVGALLLWHPVSHAPGRVPLSLLDAVFTSTSAVCVTGLTVRSTGNDLSFFGQAVVMGLIQLGGIGIMTVTTYLTFGAGRGSGLRDRAVASETLGAGERSDLRRLMRNVILLTLFFEGIGALILWIRNLWDYPPHVALWHAMFHSVAAFCNAGFGLLDDNLIPYQRDPLVNLTIGGLIVIGGLGFPVLLDIRRHWRGPWGGRWNRLQLHSKLMLIGTILLLVGGTGAILLLEWEATLRGMPLWQKLLVAGFQSTVPRTAGFNTVPIGDLTDATLFVIIVLMFIGAGPCSTGGGFKVSTLMALFHRSLSTFRGQQRVHLFRRHLPDDVVQRAMTVALLFSFVATLAVIALLVVERTDEPHSRSDDIFLDATFEVASALGTVGLTTGLTTQLSDFSRVIVIVLMFIGRLGPIAVVVALSATVRPQYVAFPEERPLIG